MSKKVRRCRRGHPLTGKNLYHRRNNAPECRACSMRRATEYQRKKVAA